MSEERSSGRKHHGSAGGGDPGVEGNPADHPALLRGVIEALFLEVCLVAQGGEIRVVNEAWRAFARAKQGDLEQVGEGVNYLAICDRASGPGSAEASRFAEGLRGVLEGSLKAFELEYPGHGPRQARGFVAHVAPLMLAGERFALVSHLDVTAVKAQDAKARLPDEEPDRLKGAFVNAVSEELRTPLTSILGFAEFLEDEIGGPLTPQQHQFVQELQRGAKRLESVLNDLLDFARLDAGTFKLTMGEAELNMKIHESLEILRPQALEARVELVAELSSEPLVIAMDHPRIGQVLINLIGNAIKFTPPGGTIKVRSCREGDGVRCEVLDSGIGIEPKDLPKLFQRFIRLAPGIRAASGAGLGLAISKSIMDAHGGQIGVESAAGKGSTFWFVLPYRPAREGPVRGDPG